MSLHVWKACCCQALVYRKEWLLENYTCWEKHTNFDFSPPFSLPPLISLQMNKSCLLKEFIYVLGSRGWVRLEYCPQKYLHYSCEDNYLSTFSDVIRKSLRLGDLYRGLFGSWFWWLEVQTPWCLCAGDSWLHHNVVERQKGKWPCAEGKK
jgi:hypothetical protein